jgi:2-polyprenyl-3-methyl-5-hydroxy-6-metoxy-1,4-benzoquinol methylase
MKAFFLKINEILKKNIDYRLEEYNFIKEYITNKENILDAGCGTGTFLNYIKKNFKDCKLYGIDQNIDNIKIAKKIEKKVKVQSITKIKDKNKYDVIVCSHVIQCLQSTDAFIVMKKFHIAIKKNGLLIISTLNDYNNFYEHPENVRPYPLAVFYRFFRQTKKIVGNQAENNTSPSHSKMPNFEIIKAKFRYEPLILFDFDQNKYLFYISIFLNKIQYFFKIRKYWKYLSYTVILKKK